MLIIYNTDQVKRTLILLNIRIFSNQAFDTLIRTRRGRLQRPPHPKPLSHLRNPHREAFYYRIKARYFRTTAIISSNQCLLSFYNQAPPPVFTFLDISNNCFRLRYKEAERLSAFMFLQCT